MSNLVCSLLRFPRTVTAVPKLTQMTASASSSSSSVISSCKEEQCPFKEPSSLSQNVVTIQCEKCKLLVDPPSTISNYFHLFQIKQEFDVDTRALSKRYKKMQGFLHPDRFASKSIEQKDYSQNWSTHLNEGYSHILKPLNRALYLLHLMGRPLLEGEVQGDTAFFSEIVEINEEVSDAETPADLSGISQANKATLEDYVKKISKAFNEGDIKMAREHVARMKYYHNIQDKIVQKEAEMGIID